MQVHESKGYTTINGFRTTPMVQVKQSGAVFVSLVGGAVVGAMLFIAGLFFGSMFLMAAAVACPPMALLFKERWYEGRCPRCQEMQRTKAAGGQTSFSCWNCSALIEVGGGTFRTKAGQ